VKDSKDDMQDVILTILYYQCTEDVILKTYPVRGHTVLTSMPL